jgi:Cys-tRNA(Pro)/Cys-tRNA(Cys) deacylase
MTSAFVLAKRAGITFEIHQYRQDPCHSSDSEEAAEKLGLDPERLFKTLFINLDAKTGAKARSV